MQYVVWGLVILLLLIHQDFWFWNDRTLVFGFMPVTLLYHAGISVAASITWLLAALFAWPIDDDDDVEANVDASAAEKGGPSK
ncbi:MAG: DUF3311 domain-containing protein [bacterium]|nr:DUF3311 domain-containing protein [bacterium]